MIHFNDLPESVKLMFKDTFEKNTQEQIKQDNQTMRDKQAQAEELKNRLTYVEAEDVFE